MLTKEPDVGFMRLFFILVFGFISGVVFALIELLLEHGFLSTFSSYVLVGCAALLAGALVMPTKKYRERV